MTTEDCSDFRRIYAERGRLAAIRSVRATLVRQGHAVEHTYVLACNILNDCIRRETWTMPKRRSLSVGERGL